MTNVGLKLVINTRIMQSPVTGLQRYLSELMRRFPQEFTTRQPRHQLGTVSSHLWEQLCLARNLGCGDLLFSPANTGPVQRTRQVITIHDVVMLDHPEWFSKAKVMLYRYVVPRAVASATRVITISEYSKRRLLAHASADPDKILVVPNGVDDLWKWRMTGPQPDEVGDSSLVPRASRYVLAFGSLAPRKNVERLLRAWADVVTYTPQDVLLVLVGCAASGRELAHAARLNGLPPRVHILGRVRDSQLCRLYHGALAFAFTSLYEGFGLPVLEAMAAGAPVLAGNRTSLPEIVKEAGVMVDPMSADAIGRGLLLLINNRHLRETLRDRGRARASMFSWDRAASETWKILHEASLI